LVSFYFICVEHISSCQSVDEKPKGIEFLSRSFFSIVSSINSIESGHASRMGVVVA
jgi:hypothetical protein